MKAIEFKTKAEKHCIRLPDAIPDGTHGRVLLMEDTAAPLTGSVDLKPLLAGLTEGLTDADLYRSRDIGGSDSPRDHSFLHRSSV